MNKNKTASAIIIIIVFFGAFAAFGAGTLYVCIEGLYFATKSHNWPSVEGEVTESRIKIKKGNKSNKRKSLVINYNYEVNGQYFSNNKAQYLDNIFYTKKDEVVARFPAGSHAAIYYQPGNPSRSVLIPGYSMFSFAAGMVFGLIFLAFGAWGFTLLKV